MYKKDIFGITFVLYLHLEDISVKRNMIKYLLKCYKNHDVNVAYHKSFSFFVRIR